MRVLSNTPAEKPTLIAPAALSVEEFCTAHRIRAHCSIYFRKRAQGRALCASGGARSLPPNQQRIGAGVWNPLRRSRDGRAQREAYPT
jgi:hypothetical protein